ncbi:uncharacterized protein [Hetaerina americana]|uniref:uncharacterized protein n=1 Tax=Hetaerina americana TaxID=62018 RepID=UPI003A7F290A
MEVVGRGSSKSSDPDVVRGHAIKEEQRDSSEEGSFESEFPGQNSIRDSVPETTLLDCVLQGDLPCIQKKAFRALQKLIQMSQPGSLSLTTTNQDKFPLKESDDRTEKVEKGAGILQSPGWWLMGSGSTGVTSKPGNEANPVDEVIKALSSNGGMSRLLEEVRDLVVDLVSNVINLQEGEEDRMRKMDKRSGDVDSKQRRRRSVVAKKGAGPVPLGFGSSPLPTKRLGEKTGVADQEWSSGKVEEPTSIQRGGIGGGSGGKKKRRNGVSTILMGILTLKSILSYIAMVFSHLIHFKQFGISVLSFLVSLARLILLIRQQNYDKHPVTDTKVVYLRPQHAPSHYGDHPQAQHYGGDYYLKRSFDSISDAAESDASAHELAYGAQKP